MPVSPENRLKCAGIGLCKTSRERAGLPVESPFQPVFDPIEDFDRMRMSQYFLPTMKETPSEAQIVSHRLMLRAGLVRQTSSGIYAWLPLGLKVLRNIERIVR